MGVSTCRLARCPIVLFIGFAGNGTTLLSQVMGQPEKNMLRTENEGDGISTAHRMSIDGSFLGGVGGIGTCQCCP